MAKVTFIFEGIGMSYWKDKKWKIIFPFDKHDCHKVKFHDGSESIELNKPKTRVSVTVNSQASSPSTGMGFDKIFDLTGEQVHSSLSLRQNWNDNGVLLEIPNAMLSMEEPLKRSFRLKKGNNIVKHLGQFAYSAKAEVELLKNESITIDITGGVNFQKKYDEKDGDHRIIFNNNCDNPAFDTGDLKMLYDLIIDIPPGEEEFTVERIMPESKNIEENNTALVDNKDENSELLITPSPQPSHNLGEDDPSDKLPCYFTVVSKLNE